MIDQLAATPAALQRAVHNRTPEELAQPAHDGRMSALELLCDLQDWEEISGARVARILHEEAPELEEFDDALWPIEHEYTCRSFPDVVEAFVLLRAHLVRSLVDIDEDQWQRVAVLQNRGTISLQWLMERVVFHDEEHLRAIMEALG